MNPALVDTNILSLFFRNQSLVVKNFNAYIQEYGKINISIITYYEIVSGLKHRDAQRQLTSFLRFVSYNRVLPLTTDSTTISGNVYASLRKKGTPVDDIDILIAGIATAVSAILRYILSAEKVEEEGVEGRYCTS
ncbi:MAG: type II toxin-antitoxin system VapC family toxin [Rhizonema sp. PD38]|nr:type II toxin-antitoxin system VapC family toxin [Rhizonema sp. PD38]